MSESQNQIKLFISYSHDDTPYFNVLSEGLSKIVKNSKEFEWTIWDDTKIHVGTFWDEEIQNNIKDCNIALLLVSIGFMSSNYIREKEFNEFKKKYEEKGILIFPIVFKPCDFSQWEDLSILQFFKPNGSLYDKDKKDFTYGDLLKFTETNGALIPNPNIDRYHIDLFKKIESSFAEFLRRKEIDSLKNPSNVIQSSQSNINKLSDYPKPSSLFTGRENEINNLMSSIKEHRVIAIEGLGGTGKTQICSKYIDDFVVDKTKIIWLDGSAQSNFDVFIEAAGYGDVLKGENKSNQALYSGLKDLLEEDERIIFWDNFNDYEDNSFYEFISFAHTYFKKSTIILITKTEPNIKGITSLHSIKIEGLNDDAIDYAKKIKSSNPKYSSISDSDLDKICLAVEGHPLAIEFSMLLVSYGKTVNEIISHMPEYSSLRKIEEFSKRLFLDILNHSKTTEAERELFLKCSVFKDNFSSKEIEYISDKKDIFNSLVGLVEKLLISTKENQYYIHPLVRSFSYEMLIEKSLTHKKAAEYYIILRKETLDASLEEKIFFHLSNSNEWEAISDYIEKNGRKFISQGLTNLLYDFINKLSDYKIKKPIFDIFIGDIYQIKGDYEKAISYYQNANDINNEFKIRAQSQIKYGEIIYRKGEVNQALLLFENAYKFSQDNNLSEEEARSLNDLGLAYRELNKLDLSFKKNSEALKLKLEIGDEEEIAISYNNIGVIHVQKDEYKKALELFQKSIVIAEKIGSKTNLALYISNYGDVLTRQGKFKEALSKINKAIEINTKIGDKSGLGQSLNILGRLYIEQGYLDKGLKKFEESLEIAKEVGDKRIISGSYNNIGVYHLKNKNYKTGIKYIFDAIILNKETGNKTNELNNIDWIKTVNLEKSNEEFKEIIISTYNNLDEKNKKLININDFINIPLTREKPKVGRNEACPCNSGKKYKYCHGKD